MPNGSEKAKRQKETEEGLRDAVERGAAGDQPMGFDSKGERIAGTPRKFSRAPEDEGFLLRGTEKAKREMRDRTPMYVTAREQIQKETIGKNILKTVKVDRVGLQTEGSEAMPLSAKGKKIMGAMKKTYGAKKAERVFHASKNKGTISDVEKQRPGNTEFLIPKPGTGSPTEIFEMPEGAPYNPDNYPNDPNYTMIPGSDHSQVEVHLVNIGNGFDESKY